MTAVPETLTPAQIHERIAAAQAAQAAPVAPQRQYQYVKPLSDAAEGLIEYISNPEGRFMLGLSDVDAMTRGFGRGEMVYVTGRAHSGKTQLVLNAIVNNPDRHVIIFTPDEVSELVLSKLYSIRYGVSAELIEERIKQGDTHTIKHVRHAAAKEFSNLVVIDDSLSLRQMTDAVNEAQDLWGAQVDAIVYDFLELLPGDGDDASGVSAKSKAMKRWLKQVDCTGFIVHQSAKSTSPRGQAAGMDGMRYGGDTEAIFVLEVYRKADGTDLDDFERRRHANTITVNLCKNKRPPSKKGEVDLYMDPDTGFVRRLGHDDMTAMTEVVAATSSADGPVVHGLMLETPRLNLEVG